MALVDTIRSAVKIAKDVTSSLQVEVTLRAWKDQDEAGANVYASSVKYPAIVDQKQQERKTSSGKIVMTRASVMILKPVTPNGAAGRVEPIDPRDILILHDGTTGPIVEASGFVDAGTERPFFHEVWIG